MHFDKNYWYSFQIMISNIRLWKEKNQKRKKKKRKMSAKCWMHFNKSWYLFQIIFIIVAGTRISFYSFQKFLLKFLLNLTKIHSFLLKFLLEGISFQNFGKWHLWVSCLFWKNYQDLSLLKIYHGYPTIKAFWDTRAKFGIIRIKGLKNCFLKVHQNSEWFSKHLTCLVIMIDYE